MITHERPQQRPHTSTETQTINLNPAEPALDARHLDDLIQLWLDAQAAELTPRTVANYEDRLAYFRDWWKQEGPRRDWQLTRRALAEYGKHLIQLDNATRPGRLGYHTQNDAIRRLKQCFKWAQAAGYVSMDYSPWLPKPAGEPKRRTAASLDDLQSLLAAAERSSSPARNRAILAMLIGTGMRVDEAAGLMVDDLRIDDDGSGAVQVQGKRTTANRSGRRTIAIDSSAGAMLREYIEAAGITTGPLFPSYRGADRPLTRHGIYVMVKWCIEEAGLGAKLTATHDLRRAYATHLARYAVSSGAAGQISGDMIRRQLGHTNYKMTAEHYTLFETEDLQKHIISPLTMIERRQQAGEMAGSQS